MHIDPVQPKQPWFNTIQPETTTKSIIIANLSRFATYKTDDRPYVENYPFRSVQCSDCKFLKSAEKKSQCKAERNQTDQIVMWLKVNRFTLIINISITTRVHGHASIVGCSLSLHSMFSSYRILKTGQPVYLYTWFASSPSTRDPPVNYSVTRWQGLVSNPKHSLSRHQLSGTLSPFTKSSATITTFKAHRKTELFSAALWHGLKSSPHRRRSRLSVDASTFCRRCWRHKVDGDKKSTSASMWTSHNTSWHIYGVENLQLAGPALAHWRPCSQWCIAKNIGG